MKKRAKQCAEYPVRGIPPEVNELMNEALEYPSRGRSNLVGQWTPDPAFDEIIAAQRQIDWDKWK